MNVAKRLKESAKIALNRLPAALSGFAIRDDDVFLVSYPKSGNTWTRFLVGNLASGADGSVGFDTIDRVVPDIYKTTADVLDSLEGQRFIKSHAAFRPEYGKVIFIVRNPLDVMVSYFHFQKKVRTIPADTAIEDYAQVFLDRAGPYGTWAQNVGSWLGAMDGSPNFLLLRYEDMLDDTASALAKIAQFAGLDGNEATVARAVELSSADNMRRLEQEQQGAWKATKDSDKSIPFVRKAGSGGWRDEVSDELAARIRERWADTMARLGYDA